MKVRLAILSCTVICMSLITGPSLAAADGVDPDWPCVQRLLPEIVGGMIWSGPPLEEVAKSAEEEKDLESLASELAARRVQIEAAEQHIEVFANELDNGRKASTLTNLFKITLDFINRDRTSIINGIKKFSQGQRNLADRIKAKNQEIETIDKSEILKLDTLRAERDWDIRIFEDRRRSLVYLCEQPVLLEQRAFALARAIAGHLE